MQQLSKTLYFLPTEIIYIIQSYLIQKIPKSDFRYRMLDRLYYYYFRPYAQQKQELLWNSGEHRGWLIKFQGFSHLVLLIDILPKTFIEYSFQNLYTGQRGDYRVWSEPRSGSTTNFKGDFVAGEVWLGEWFDYSFPHLNLGPTTQPINA
jgi:hypothetical protein